MKQIQLKLQIENFLQNIEICNPATEEGMYINEIYNLFIKEYSNDTISKINFARLFNKIILDNNLKIIKRKKNKGHQYYNIKLKEELSSKDTFLFFAYSFITYSCSILLTLTVLEHNIKSLYQIL